MREYDDKNKAPAPKMPVPPSADDAPKFAPANFEDENNEMLDKPELTQIEKQDLAKKEVAQKAAAKSGPVKVVATRAGFFKGHRKVEGDIFELSSMLEWGSWMKKI